MYDDTIAAISTAVGDAGIGIVRISGPQALPVLQRVFRVVGRDAAPHGETPRFDSHRVYYGRAVDPATGGVLDEALAICMLAPRSYTREDVVELHCHGGPVPVQRVLLAVLQAGARLALPGEFTMRAYLNGRVDLAQAEAVADVIRARTDRGLSLAMKGLSGQLSHQVRSARQRLLRVLAYLEATIDFSEDDIPPEDVAGPLTAVLETVDSLLATADQGIISRQGVRVAILGRPNAGKSSLLNALLRTDRAIVTEIPGTTRDTLEEYANFSGVPVCLVDTAGIGESGDLVERLGIERSRRAMAEADLCLLVVDASERLRQADLDIAWSLAGKPAIIVANKSDLLPATSHEEIARLVAGARVVPTSAVAATGLDDLRQAVLEAIFSGGVVQSDELLVSSPRHKEALSRAASHLRDALGSIGAGLPADCTASDVRLAVDALGEITGETATEDLLQTIFSHFCVGK
ncbi:MAG: tRNA uridine-5-carboxymethylaminomethyl(34) synthesis GTPase MnmE [Actinobacteria bacterium]|nr:tRNA uridine-5-carboxymethylaminomethyl(34) synthesis GTPase MnmE [Actinomycetota bacterium]